MGRGVYDGIMVYIMKVWCDIICNYVYDYGCGVGRWGIYKGNMVYMGGIYDRIMEYM